MMKTVNFVTNEDFSAKTMIQDTSNFYRHMTLYTFNLSQSNSENFIWTNLPHLSKNLAYEFHLSYIPNAQCCHKVIINV